MGLMDRLKRVTRAQMHALLDSLEDPATMLPQLVRELHQNAKAAAHGEAKARAAARAAQRRVDETVGQIARLERGAQLALTHGDEQTAREAVAAQIRAEHRLKEEEAALKRAQDAVEQAAQAHKELVACVAEAQTRCGNALARHEASVRGSGTTQLQADGQEILDEVAAMEERLPEQDAGAPETGRPAREAPLEDRLRQLEREAKIDERLRQIRDGKRKS
ncbi:MAG: PspA/IM30 family protein [Kiritimatiellae bacterium]|nr:PspA/IM30 family protein [Kiritimatiellia bacterium]